MYVLTRDQSRQLDAAATEEFGIPSIVLMENAAHALADEAMRLIARGGLGRVVVFAGPGNNGGDGFAAARLLHNAGCDVRVCLAADPDRVKGDSATNLAIIRAMHIEIHIVETEDPLPTLEEVLGDAAGAGLAIDALLGTGLARVPRPPISRLIERINALGAAGWTVLAADSPSGLDIDTGETPGMAVRADVTVTFGANKPAFVGGDGQPLCGRVVVGDLGVPRALLDRLGERV
jgi:hydroxyethylthiazole kinase-like uncharacterized protein yjeF